MPHISAIVIPSYKETEALPVFLNELLPLMNDNDIVVIADDSPLEQRQVITTLCNRAGETYSVSIYYSFAEKKMGRGAAVRRGMELIRKQFPTVERIIECDADGSHRAIDVISIKNSELNPDLLIGSRYLSSSEILGWPVSRRIFSRALNFLIPRILGLQINDVTNGLRRYSIQAVEKIITTRQVNNGFIYLSEQAKILVKSGYTIDELPIVFVNRIAGSSTVGSKEIIDSLRGIFGLIVSRRKN